MRNLIIRDSSGQCLIDVPEDQISEYLPKSDHVIWLDISNPDAQDVAVLRDEFHFHPLAIEDAFHDTQRPKIDTYPGYYLVVFYSARYLVAENRIDIQELDLFVGRNYLVSVHDGTMTQIQETIARWRSPDNSLDNSIAALLYALLDTIVDDYFPLIDQIADRVDELEDAIFSKFDEDAIQTIFQLKKDMLLLRRSIAPERDVLNVLLRREIPIFATTDTIYLQDVYDHIIRVTDSIDTYRDLLSSALDSFLSLQSNKLNQIVKILTITSIILMADALVAGIYGMNFDVMPELRWQFGYPWALGLMGAIDAGLIIFFRVKKWI